MLCSSEICRKGFDCGINLGIVEQHCLIANCLTFSVKCKASITGEEAPQIQSYEAHKSDPADLRISYWMKVLEAHCLSHSLFCFLLQRPSSRLHSAHFLAAGFLLQQHIFLKQPSIRHPPGKISFLTAFFKTYSRCRLGVQAPGTRFGSPCRLGRLGCRLGRLGCRLGRLGCRLGRLGVQAPDTRLGSPCRRDNYDRSKPLCLQLKADALHDEALFILCITTYVRAFAEHIKMDRNKDEAARLKDIAEVKMQGKEFVHAKELLLKALKISPDIENASRMLAVCEVHCSAGNLVNGQIGHYGILQAEVSADESSIRKQYRKLALLLHPDKNKFAGAEAAFKLVGEAYDVLSDQASRKVYDAKISVQMRTATSRNTTSTFAAQNNAFGRRKQRDQQPPSAFSSARCFLTMCPFCNCRFQCSLNRLYHKVRCQKCFRKFYAFDFSHQKVKPHRSSSGFSSNRAGFQETATPSQFSTNHGSQTRAPKSSKPPAPTNNGYGSRTKEERLDPNSIKTSSVTNRHKVNVNRSSSGFSSNHNGFQETATPSQFSDNHGSQTRAPKSSEPAAPTNNGHGSGTKEERLDPNSIKPSSGTNRRKIKVTRSSSGFSSNRADFQETATPSQFSNNLGSQTRAPQSSKPAAPANNGCGSGTKQERPDPPSVKPSSGTNRHKINVTYREDLSPDDVRPQKRLRKTDSSVSKNSDPSSHEGGIFEIISMFERIILAD